MRAGPQSRHRPKKTLAERRRNRPIGAAEALQCALDCAAGRGELDVMLIADDGGLVVCNSRTNLDLRMLAAVTPMVARGRVTAQIKRKGESRELSVRTIDLLGETFHVAALGGAFGAREREIASSVAAARRILA